MNEKTTENIDLRNAADRALEALDARSVDIIIRRFGLKSDQIETLESIGNQYGITRERVRQIESNARKLLSELDEPFTSVYALFAGVFEAHGGVLTQDNLVSLLRDEVNSEITSNLVGFHLTILPNFSATASDATFVPHWRHEPSVKDYVENAVRVASDILEKKAEPIALNDLSVRVQNQLKEKGIHVPTAHVRALLVASIMIEPTAFGEWGLSGWAETSPRGVGDKAFAVLRRHKKPAHFREITDLINEAGFDQKQANPQTVHNELIKDGRFVLVGRGLYGLKEAGYKAETVADVLTQILGESDSPMAKEDLVKRVLDQRMVKKNTVLLSLQNNDRFERVDSGSYKLKSIS